MSKKLEGNTATLTLSNWHSLTIKTNNSGDGVYYQFNNGSEVDEIQEAEIEYIEDTENADDEDGLYQPAFKVGDQYYFIGQFMRDNF